MPAARFPGLKVTTPAFQARKCRVQVPRESLWLLSLKARTPASQAGNVGFKSHRSYCGHRIMVIRQIVILLMLMGVRFPLVTPWMGMPSGEGSGL